MSLQPKLYLRNNYIFQSFCHSSFLNLQKRKFGKQNTYLPTYTTVPGLHPLFAGRHINPGAGSKQTPGPLPHILLRLSFRWAGQAHGAAWPWAEVGAEACWHAGCPSSFWRPPVCKDGPTSGSSQCFLPSVPPWCQDGCQMTQQPTGP